jgi:hypothetical protein
MINKSSRKNVRRSFSAQISMLPGRNVFEVTLLANASFPHSAKVEIGF